MDAFLFFLGLAVLFCAWAVSDWISANAEEAKERAKKAQLENTRIELEIAALKAGSGPLKA